MNFYTFPSQAEAAETEAQIVANVRGWVDANFPDALSPEGYLRGTNAATGERADAVTTNWDSPRALNDGRWAILKPSAERVAPMPLADALAGITADEISQAEYEAASPQAEGPLS